MPLFTMPLFLIFALGALLYATCAVAAGALLRTGPALRVLGVELAGLVPFALASWTMLALLLALVALRVGAWRRG